MPLTGLYCFENTLALNITENWKPTKGVNLFYVERSTL